MKVTLLDGSIGQELVHRHGAAPTPWWSTKVMQENPGLVTALHRDYAAAGATIATANTYALLPDRLRGSGLEASFHALLETAARAARDGAGGGRVAGSLGPLGASYRTDFSHTLDQAVTLYRDVVTVLEPLVDLFIAETVASLHQVKNVLHVIEKLSEKPLWLAVTTDDFDGTRLRSGEPLAEVATLLSGHRAEAVLVNCTRTEAVPAALEILAGFGRPFGAYANGFTRIAEGFLEDRPTVDALTARADLSPGAYADHAMAWLDQGASILGGCCEVGPAHIAEIARRLRAAGHEIV